MKKKNLWIAGIFVVGLMMIVGIIRYIEVQKRENDPNWQIAKEIYKVENALKEVDEDYECQSVAKVRPFTYTDSEGNTIVYYCIQTAYLENESGDHTGLDINAIGMVIDPELIGNKRECRVNEYDAFLCKLGDQSYLCWTLSPELSCVIEYSAEAISEESIFRMAESVPVS
ncbi:MAG: hypothetical protein IJB47_06000 [Oscillospiraceae bacterium]|nr:hypothetical protein [Oscillospiraceae bacterium]